MQKHHCTLQKEAFFNYSSNHTMPPETHKHMFVQAPACVCVCVCSNHAMSLDTYISQRRTISCEKRIFPKQKKFLEKTHFELSKQLSLHSNMHLFLSNQMLLITQRNTALQAIVFCPYHNSSLRTLKASQTCPSELLPKSKKNSPILCFQNHKRHSTAHMFHIENKNLYSKSYPEQKAFLHRIKSCFGPGEPKKFLPGGPFSYC